MSHPQIFISHCHDDKDIADKVRENLQDWGHSKIFQTSDARHGPRIGEPLDQALRDALSNTKLIILLYTFSDKDWSWCMWECGVATDTKPEHIRVVVLQCTEDVPKLFEGQIRIELTPNDILKFTTQFHKEPSFFPEESAFAPNIPEGTLQRRSDRLYADLRTVIPARRLEERYRWDFLTLVLNSEIVTEVKDQRDEETAIDIMKGNCIITKSFGEAFKHFGFGTFEPDKSLSEIIERWESSVEEEVPKEWIYDLYGELLRAIRNRPSVPKWIRFKSARASTDWWFYPVVNIVRTKPDGKMEFDIYLYEVPPPSLDRP